MPNVELVRWLRSFFSPQKAFLFSISSEILGKLFGQIIIQSRLLHATFSCGTKVCNFTVTCEVIVQHKVIHLRLHLCGGKLRVIYKSAAIADFSVEHLASVHCLVRLDEVNDIVRHLIVATPRDVLHLVVDDDWCDVVLLLEDFGCLGGEGCGGMGAGDGDGIKENRSYLAFLGQRYERRMGGEKTMFTIQYV